MLLGLTFTSASLELSGLPHIVLQDEASKRAAAENKVRQLQAQQVRHAHPYPMLLLLCRCIGRLQQ